MLSVSLVAYSSNLRTARFVRFVNEIELRKSSVVPTLVGRCGHSINVDTRKITPEALANSSPVVGAQRQPWVTKTINTNAESVRPVRD
jgi:hypothetical protein